MPILSLFLKVLAANAYFVQLDDNWRLSRCLCGAVIGRCQERQVDDRKTTIYRVLKYAVRLVSQAVE